MDAGTASTEDVFGGAHFEEPISDSPGEAAAIETVLASSIDAMPKGVMRKLGGLSFSKAMNDPDREHVGQFRSEPIDGSGMEFRLPLRRRKSGAHDVPYIIAQLVNGAVCVTKIAADLRDIAGDLRLEAERIISQTGHGLSPMRLLGIGITPAATADQVSFTVDVSMLGYDLQTRLHRVTDRDSGNIMEGLARLVVLHIRRRNVLAQAMAAGGRAWIDDAAVLVMSAAGIGRADMLARLERSQQVRFSFGGEDGLGFDGDLRWEDGTIKTYVAKNGGEFSFEIDTLRIDPALLPATVIADLVGRRLRDVIDLKFIPPKAPIVGSTEAGRILDIKLEIGRTIIGDLE